MVDHLERKRNRTTLYIQLYIVMWNHIGQLYILLHYHHENKNQSLPLQQADPSFLSLGFLFQFLHWGVILGQFLTWNHPSSSFFLHFNLNKWISHRSRFFSLWFHHLSVVVCCSSSCAALFDFPSSCGVDLIHIERSIIQSKIWASTLQIRRPWIFWSL